MTDGGVLVDVGDNALVSVDWHGLGTAQIVSVTYSLPVPLTYTDVAIMNDATPPFTNLRVAGAEHGQTYMCEAQVVLDTNEILNRQFVIKGFNN